MNTGRWLLVLVGMIGLAQAQTVDPAKIEDFKKRFAQAVQLEKAGQFKEARIICEGILAEEPKARGSLFLAGQICLGLEDFSQAAVYLERFRILEPKAPEGVILLLQTYQVLKMKEKVEALRKELYQLQADRAPGIADMESFGREKMRVSVDSLAIILEFFDYRRAPYRLWELKQLTTGSKVPRDLAIIYEPGGETENFKLVEYMIMPDGTYRQAEWIKKMPKPDYETAKARMLAVLQQAPPAR
jgi:tetratricopeptide (TPR) repeat protein